jgi:predicted Rossmann fold flavoprotein
LIIKDKWIKYVRGLSLKNVRITVLQNNKKKITKLGEALFTHFGLSGPIILEMSSKIGDLLKKGEVKLSLDLKPGLDFSKLDRRIQRDFQKYSNKLFRNSLNDLLPQKMIPLIVKLCEINPNKKVNAINKPERQKLVKIFKNIEMVVEKLSGFKKAIITKGGISLKEIDSKTMKSKLIDNLFFAGEILDLNGPSGGYNLQVCWTTGYLAGQSSAS